MGFEPMTLNNNHLSYNPTWYMGRKSVCIYIYIVVECDYLQTPFQLFENINIDINFNVFK